MATTASRAAADRAVGARVGAVLVALWWMLPFYGVIDLSVAVFPSEHPEWFAPFMVLETSWGLLYTFLLPLPLIAWAVLPARWVGPQVVVIAGAVLVAGLASVATGHVFAIGQVFIALVMAASAAFPRMWRPPTRWSARRLFATAAWWPAVALVGVGLGMALVHAGDVLLLARSGVEDSETWGLMHLPMQAAFALAVPAAAGVALLAAAHRVRGWWVAVVPAAVSAVWFGVVAMHYPDQQLGSPGQVGGMCAVCWGAALPVIVWGTGWLQRSAAPRT